MHNASWIVLPTQALIVCFSLLSCQNAPLPNTVTFAKTLSSYGLYQGPMGELTPSPGVDIYELASPLFTDYADKQRLMLLPEGARMVANDAGLPDFPEGSLLAKTFYYNEHFARGITSRRVLETRLLLLHEGIWNAATYRWNEAQDEAFLLTTGTETSITFLDPTGKKRNTVYQIPTNMDCQSCHKQGDVMSPLGPKARNINVVVDKNGQSHNQLDYLRQQGKLVTTTSNFPTTPNYEDLRLDLVQRARAYLDLNCAHCHNSQGNAFYMGLDLGLETPSAMTNLRKKGAEVFSRMTVSGELHMPKIGTTMHHDEGISLIKEYLQTLSTR
ncbi:MAG: hypothetical protein AAFZ52_11230 [Bacteroidota bacterium]